MGVIDGAHGYMFQRTMETGEGQMGNAEYDIASILKDLLRRNTVANYTKEQFVKDYVDIANALGFLVDNRLYGKSLILKLIGIKLDHGDGALRLEIQKINAQRRPH